MGRLGMVAAATAVLVGGLGVEPAEGARTLRQGMSGEDVRQLQRKLTACGELVSPDAMFGVDTRQAVERFERAHQLRSMAPLMRPYCARWRVVAARSLRAEPAW